MRSRITGIKTVAWNATGAQHDPRNAPPATGGQRVSLQEGPITGEKIYRVMGWDFMSDGGRVRKLRRMAEDYGNDPRMRWYVVTHVLAGNTNPRDTRAEVQAIHQWVMHHIHYTNESTEQIQSPWWTLKYRTGDCDDMALLMAAMLASIAVPFRFVLAGTGHNGQPKRWVEGEGWPMGNWTHIYLLGGDRPFEAQSWIPMEPTIRGLPTGHDPILHGVPGHLNHGQDIPAQQPRAMAGYGAWGEAGPAAQPVGRIRGQEYYDELRSLPPWKVVQEVGVLGLVKDWVDWHRVSSSVVEGTLSAIILGAVLSRFQR